MMRMSPSVSGSYFILRMAALVFCVFLVTGLGNAGEKRWVTANGAKLKADKTASSDTIAMLPGGTEVTLISTEKQWCQVSVDSGKTGWVYRGKLASDPPGDTDADAKLIGDLAETGIALDAADTSRSIRGKSELPKFALKTETEEIYSDALDTVLSFYAGDREIEEFLKAGKIGEYAD